MIQTGSSTTYWLFKNRIYTKPVSTESSISQDFELRLSDNDANENEDEIEQLDLLSGDDDDMEALRDSRNNGRNNKTKRPTSEDLIMQASGVLHQW